MKCKERKQVIITSSAESSIAEILATDKRILDSMFLQLFTTIRYDRTNNSLRFINLRELWEHGLFVKRYLEYPGVGEQKYDEFFAELNVYSQQGEYVTHHIDENKTDTFSDPLLITDISLDTSEIFFWSWTERGALEVHNMSFDEYYALFLSCISCEQGVARFDIFQLVSSNEICENYVEKLVEYVRRGRIHYMDRIRCVRKINDEDIEKSIQVLCEWFEVFVLVATRLYEKGILLQDALWEDADKVLFARNGISTSKRQLEQVLKRYNELLKRLEQSLVRGRNN